MGKKEKLQNILDKFDFVLWDRVIPFDGGIDIYGWIKREGDAYKDFVLLMIIWIQNDDDINEGMWSVEQCFTSSPKYSLEVNNLSGFTNTQHTDCIKVADYISNLTN